MLLELIRLDRSEPFDPTREDVGAGPGTHRRRPDCRSIASGPVSGDELEGYGVSPAEDLGVVA